jgi:hypothetical protein
MFVSQDYVLKGRIDPEAFQTEASMELKEEDSRHQMMLGKE